MNQVYVFNDNTDNSFLSILMNDLNDRGIMFSNVKSTRSIDYNNILIYIPVINSSDCILDFIRNNRNNLFKFKRILVICGCMVDYNTIRNIHTDSFIKSKFKHYCGIAFDTLLSRIIADDCDRIMSNIR